MSGPIESNHLFHPENYPPTPPISEVPSSRTSSVSSSSSITNADTTNSSKTHEGKISNLMGRQIDIVNSKNPLQDLESGAGKALEYIHRIAGENFQLFHDLEAFVKADFIHKYTLIKKDSQGEGAGLFNGINALFKHNLKIEPEKEENLENLKAFSEAILQKRLDQLFPSNSDFKGATSGFQGATKEFLKKSFNLLNSLKKSAAEPPLNTAKKNQTFSIPFSKRDYDLLYKVGAFERDLDRSIYKIGKYTPTKILGVGDNDNVKKLKQEVASFTLEQTVGKEYVQFVKNLLHQGLNANQLFNTFQKMVQKRDVKNIENVFVRGLSSFYEIQSENNDLVLTGSVTFGIKSIDADPNDPPLPLAKVTTTLTIPKEAITVKKEKDVFNKDVFNYDLNLSSCSWKETVEDLTDSNESFV